VTAVTRTLRMPVVSRLYRLASVKHADTCGLVLLFGIVVGFSDDRRLLVLILLVFFVLVVIIIVVWVSRRQCLPVMPTDNQVEKFSRMCGVMSVPLGMSHRSLVRAATGLAPCASRWPWTVLNVLPGNVARQATFLGETDPRAARPLGASLPVRQLGAPSGRPVNAIRHRGSCRCRLVPRLGVGMLNDSAPAKRGEIEDGTKKAFLTSDARMESRPRERAFGPCSRYTLAMLNHGYINQTLRRPLATKDGGSLRTLADAANYIIALPEDRRRSHWDRTAQLILDMADPSEISRQLELALFYDRQLNLKRPLQHTC
jgi:hypothetical protein